MRPDQFILCAMGIVFLPLFLGTGYIRLQVCALILFACVCTIGASAPNHLDPAWAAGLGAVLITGYLYTQRRR